MFLPSVIPSTPVPDSGSLKEGSRDVVLSEGVAVLRINPFEFLISDYYTAGGQNGKIN